MILNIIKNNRGITLIELVIVLAIISILGAIFVPNFTNITIKAKIKSDIQSAKVIKNAIDLYELENNKTMVDKEVKNILKILIDQGYLNLHNGFDNKPQTENAEWYYDKDNKIIKIKINIPKAILESLSSDEKFYILETQ